MTAEKRDKAVKTDWGEHQKLFEQARQEAIAKLSGSEDVIGFDDVLATLNIETTLSFLGAEYNDAIEEERGMDPEKVVSLVQNIINVAQFPKDNQPRENPPDYDPPDNSIVEPDLDPDLDIWLYSRNKRGRPKGAAYDEHALATVVTEIAEEFDLRIYPSDHVTKKTRRPSAVEIVAAAQAARRSIPHSVEVIKLAYMNAKNSDFWAFTTNAMSPKEQDDQT